MERRALDGVIVFAGPTLYPALAQGGCREALPPWAELRPPAARGDVLRALSAEPHTIVLLDGVYFTEPAVTHKELLYTLQAGVRVLGAASLGALRAVELERHGMVGVGRVFERFRSGELEGDDEVALLHAPAERAFRPLTVALVELREAVDGLVREGLLRESAGADLVAAVKGLAFSDRSLDRVRALAADAMPGAAAETLLRRLEAPGVKWRDALAALGLAATEPARPPKSRSEGQRTPETEFSVWFKEEHMLGATAPAGGGPTLLQALRTVQLLHPEAPALVRRLRLRFLLATEGSRAGLEPSEDEVEAAASALRPAAGNGARPAVLPAPELRAEARVRLLAEAASARHGGPDAALAALARRLGLPPRRAEENLLALVASRRGLFPDWSAARALALTSPLQPALAAAAAAEEVHHCFLRWRGGGRAARVATRVLVEVASGLWRVPPRAVHEEAGRRGLYPSTGHSPGLFEALEWLAPAERLPEPINGYPGARAALLATPLTPSLSIHRSPQVAVPNGGEGATTRPTPPLRWAGVPRPTLSPDTPTPP
ncbi:MAG TPA: TfuA-like protein, partial [Thermoanaerobaculia bacterium]|nr:TfuA-like protein [Thermoanaerobaculia bacterium]